MKRTSRSSQIIMGIGFVLVAGIVAAVFIGRDSLADTQYAQPLRIGSLSMVSSSNAAGNYPRNNAGLIQNDNYGISVFTGSFPTPYTECGSLGMPANVSTTSDSTIANTWENRSGCNGAIAVGAADDVVDQTLTLTGTTSDNRPFTLNVNVPAVPGNSLGNWRFYVDDTGGTYYCRADHNFVGTQYPNDCDLTVEQALTPAHLARAGNGATNGNNLCQHGESPYITPADCGQPQRFSATVSTFSSTPTVYIGNSFSAAITITNTGSGADQFRLSLTSNNDNRCGLKASIDPTNPSTIPTSLPATLDIPSLTSGGIGNYVIHCLTQGINVNSTLSSTIQVTSLGAIAVNRPDVNTNMGNSIVSFNVQSQPAMNPAPSENSNWTRRTWNFSDGTEQSYILVRSDREYMDYVESINRQCQTIIKSRFAWKSSAGNDSADNWRNFGIPDCSGTATNTSSNTGSGTTNSGSGTSSSGNSSSTTQTPSYTEMRECNESEFPSMNNMCRMPMYKWHLTEKRWEKCDNAVTQSYTNVKDNQSAVYSNCESMNLEFDKAWRTERNLLHDPRVVGDWYTPTWNSGEKSFRYSPKTDSLESCDANSNQMPMGSTMDPNQYYSSCQPLPEIDKGWMLKRFRAEYKMFKMYRQTQNATNQSATSTRPTAETQLSTPVTTKPDTTAAKEVKPTTPLDSTYLPVSVTDVTKSECAAYLIAFRQELVGDKDYLKSIRTQLKNTPKDYPDYDTIQNLLSRATKIIGSLEKSVRQGCDKKAITELQNKKDELRNDIFVQLKTYIPDLQDYAELISCKTSLADNFKQLSNLIGNKELDSTEQKDISDMVSSIEHTLKEFSKNTDSTIYEQNISCQDLLDESDDFLAPLSIRTDDELNEIIEKVVSKRLESVKDDLTTQLEEKGRKIDELMVQIANLNKVAAEISAQVTTSYSAYTRIDEKFTTQKTEIASAKDVLIPLVEETVTATHECKCVTAELESRITAVLSQLASTNWIDGRGTEAVARVRVILTGIKSKNFTKVEAAEVERFVATLMASNTAASCKAGLTPFCDVPTNEWYFGAMVTAHDNGFMSQGRPAENVLRQEALMMLLRAQGADESKLNGNCAANQTLHVAPYAACALQLAREKGVLLTGRMDTNATRSEIAAWIKILYHLPDVDTSILENYTDLAHSTDWQRENIAAVIKANIMVGTVGEQNAAFNPSAELTRGELAVVIEKLFTTK